jgi:hypothetical protein
MAARDLEITINRKGRRADEFDVSTDPGDVSGLQAILRGWLEGHGWHAARWAEFSADVRIAGEYRVVRTVRA